MTKATYIRNSLLGSLRCQRDRVHNYDDSDYGRGCRHTVMTLGCNWELISDSTNTRWRWRQGKLGIMWVHKISPPNPCQTIVLPACTQTRMSTRGILIQTTTTTTHLKTLCERSKVVCYIACVPKWRSAIIWNNRRKSQKPCAKRPSFPLLNTQSSRTCIPIVSLHLLNLLSQVPSM